MIGGKVTPPEDFGPAIDALGDKGREFLEYLTILNGGRVEPKLIALAADHGRKHGEP